MLNLPLKISFTKGATILIVLLFLIILLLSGYVFGGSPSFLTQQQKTTLSADLTKETWVISSTKPKTFTNTSSTWSAQNLIQQPIHILAPLQIITTLSIKLAKNAPSTSSAGIILANKLEEKDVNARRLSLYYYKKNKQWILKYQAGEVTKFYGLAHTNSDNIHTTFSLRISSDGKTVLVTSPHEKNRVIDLPDSLYDITNLMHLKVVTGPYTTLIISSLSYSQSYN